MRNPQAQTIYNELADALTVLGSNSHYADRNQFEWRKLERQIEKLKSVNPAEGWTMYAILYAAAGDLSEVKRCTAEALHYHLAETDILNIISANISVGNHTAALEMVRKYCTAESGMFSAYLNFVTTLGAYQHFKKVKQKAESMGLVPDNGVPDFSIAADALENAGLTDQDIAQHMEVAGEILRRHRLVGVYKTHAVSLDEEEPSITNFIGVEATPEEIFELNIELASLQDEGKINHHPVFDVVFTKHPKDVAEVRRM